LNKLLALLFDVTIQTINKNIKNKNKSYELILKYFSKNEILEFLEKEEIEKLELIKNYTISELRELLPKRNSNIEIEVFKKINKLKRVNLRVLFVLLKYYEMDFEKNIEENITIFQKKYKTKLKIETTIKDDIVLFAHHFKTANRIFKTIFNQNDFEYMFEKKDIFLKEIKKETKKI